MVIFEVDFAAIGNWAWSTAREWLPSLEWVARLIGALVVLLLLRIASTWASRAFLRLIEPAHLGPGLNAVLLRAMRIGLLLLGLIAVLSILNLHDLALSFITGLGITGLLLAFALQEIARNLAAGLLLLFQRPFNIGDRIRLGDHEGVVQDIGLRATHIRTDDNREVMLPNAGVYTGIITNLTRYPFRRFSQTFKLSADAPLAEALATLAAAVREIEGVRDQPAPDAILLDATPTLEVRYWLPTTALDQTVINSQVAQHLRALIAERGWL